MNMRCQKAEEEMIENKTIEIDFRLFIHWNYKIREEINTKFAYKLIWKYTFSLPVKKLSYSYTKEVAKDYEFNIYFHV